MDRKLAHIPKGFSLIEVLVVLSVLSILSVGAALSVSRSSEARAATDQVRFAKAFENAVSQALQGHKTQGVLISNEGFQMAHRSLEGWQTRSDLRKWQGKAVFAGDVVAPAFGSPQIVILANGRSTPFSIRFSQPAGGSQICRSTGWSELDCNG